MKVKTEIGIKRVKPDGEDVIQALSEGVRIIDSNTEGLSSMADLASRHAQNCIYCGSTDQLSSRRPPAFSSGRV